MEDGPSARRLLQIGAFGAVATLAGGAVFVTRFGVLEASGNPLLAAGFGLFVVGLVALAACVIALLGIGIGSFAAERGWAAAAAVTGGPLALLWALWAVGAVGYTIPAVLSLIVIGGVVAALR